MNRSRLRIGFLILVTLVVVVVAGTEFKENISPDSSLEAQVRKLDGYWSSGRRAAAKELAQYPGEADKVVPALVKALGDSDLEVRLNTIDALKIHGVKSAPAGSALREMLTADPDTRIRKGAAALLGVIKDKESVALLTKALDDPAPGVRLEALRALGWFGTGISSEALVDKVLSILRSDKSEEMRDASIETLDSLARDQEPAARAIATAAAQDSSAVVRYKAVGIMKTPKFAFQIPALIAALEDPSPHIRLTAGANLAWIGMADDRVAPALCKAALNADASTREGVGSNVDLLILERPGDKTPDDQITRKYLTAVGAFQSILDHKEAAAREQTVSALGRMITSYRKSGKPGLLEPSKVAVQALIARIDDESESVPIRIHAMNECNDIHRVGDLPSLSQASAGSPSLNPDSDMHYRALYIAALGRAVKSPAGGIPSRALELLIDNFKDSGNDASIRDAWRKLAPDLAGSIKSDDRKVAFGALVLVGMLGPQAREILPSLRSLARDTRDTEIRSALEGAIKSISSVDDLKDKNADTRIAAAEALGRLGWPAVPGLPVLTTLLKDPEVKVRIAAANALKALGEESKPSLPGLAAALAGESQPTVRAAILEAMEAIASGTPAVLDAHRLALRDPDPSVRAMAATFKKVPTDDATVTALAGALGDSGDDIRVKSARVLAEIFLQNSNVIPTLLKALGDETSRRTAVVQALGAHLDNTSDSADFNRVRGNIPALMATVGAAVPALKDALTLKDPESRVIAFNLLGRIAYLAHLSRDPELRKGVEPALDLYLTGLGETDPAIREEVFSRIDAIPVHQPEIIAALQKFLDRSDLSAEDREAATRAVKAQKAGVESAARKRAESP